MELLVRIIVEYNKYTMNKEDPLGGDEVEDITNALHIGLEYH